VKRAAPCLFLGVLTACTTIPSVGPEYLAPKPPIMERWRNAPAGSGEEVLQLTAWWERFEDPILTELITAAFGANRDLIRAESRLREARAWRRIAGAGFLPDIGAYGDYVRRDPSDGASESAFSPGATGLRTNYDVGFDAVWEIDIFGGVRRSYEAADADLAASEAERNGVRVSLAGEVAREYVLVRSLDRRIAIAERNIASLADSLDIVDARFKAGVSSELDVAQARAELETTRARVPALRRDRAAAGYRLGIVLGEEPAAIDARLAPVSGTVSPVAGTPLVPVLPVVTAIGTPSEVVRRRPDIARAERELAAANARIGVAVADLYPRVDLAAAFGYVSGSTATLFDTENRSWSFIPGIRLPIFSGGKLRAAVAVASEQDRQALARYESTVLGALAECESAFVAYEEELKRGLALRAALQASERALTLARELYDRGVIDFLRVIDAERTTFQNADELAESDRAMVAALVAIYKALGGDPEGGKSSADVSGASQAP